MANQKEVASATKENKSVEITPAENVEVVSTAHQGEEMTDLARILNDSSDENLDNSKKAYSLNSEYLALKIPGENFKGVFIGFGNCTVNDQNTGEQRVLDAVRFVRNAKSYIHAGANLVSTFRRSNLQVGSKVSITYKGDDKNVKLFEVEVLM